MQPLLTWTALEPKQLIILPLLSTSVPKTFKIVAAKLTDETLKKVSNRPLGKIYKS